MVRRAVEVRAKAALGEAIENLMAAFVAIAMANGLVVEQKNGQLLQVSVELSSALTPTNYFLEISRMHGGGIIPDLRTTCIFLRSPSSSIRECPESGICYPVALPHAEVKRAPSSLL